MMCGGFANLACATGLKSIINPPPHGAAGAAGAAERESVVGLLQHRLWRRPQLRRHSSLP
jgi:hypothetical protein